MDFMASGLVLGSRNLEELRSGILGEGFGLDFGFGGIPTWRKSDFVRTGHTLLLSLLRLEERSKDNEHGRRFDCGEIQPWRRSLPHRDGLPVSGL